MSNEQDKQARPRVSVDAEASQTALDFTQPIDWQSILKVVPSLIAKTKNYTLRPRLLNNGKLIGYIESARCYGITFNPHIRKFQVKFSFRKTNKEHPEELIICKNFKGLGNFCVDYARRPETINMILRDRGLEKPPAKPDRTYPGKVSNIKDKFLPGKFIDTQNFAVYDADDAELLPPAPPAEDAAAGGATEEEKKALEDVGAQMGMGDVKDAAKKPASAAGAGGGKSPDKRIYVTFTVIPGEVTIRLSNGDTISSEDEIRSSQLFVPFGTKGSGFNCSAGFNFENFYLDVDKPKLNQTMTLTFMEASAPNEAGQYVAAQSVIWPKKSREADTKTVGAPAPVDDDGPAAPARAKQVRL